MVPTWCLRLPPGHRADSTAAHSEVRQSEGISRASVMRQLNLFVGGMNCRRCVREMTARLRAQVITAGQ